MNDKLRIVLKTLAVVLFLVSIAIIGITAIKNHMRKDISKDAIKVVESAIEEGGDKKVTFEVPVSDFYQHETLTLIGILEIPCIDVKEPIWDSCSSTALRFGVGRFPQTAQIGEDANCTIFGHRMRQSQTIFWQLQMLEEHIGEEVIVTTTDGIQHRYTISDTVYVTDAAIDPYLSADLFDSEHLCLATCGYGTDPYNSKIYRPKNTEFIVICVPEN